MAANISGSDRDIVVRCIAEGGDPTTAKASELAQGKPVTIGADDPVEEALRTMSQHQVRRLPVIDGHDLIGMVSQADIARNLPEDKVGELVEAATGRGQLWPALAATRLSWSGRSARPQSRRGAAADRNRRRQSRNWACRTAPNWPRPA